RGSRPGAGRGACASVTAPRFGIVLLPESLAGWGALCREAEDSGFDLLGVADSQSVFREMYVALTLAALNTSRVRLGPLVTNPLTRHLVVTASAVSSVDEVSGARSSASARATAPSTPSARRPPPSPASRTRWSRSGGSPAASRSTGRAGA